LVVLAVEFEVWLNPELYLSARRSYRTVHPCSICINVARAGIIPGAFPD
jgi:hypothetical protein